MTARQVFEGMLTELNKVNAPSLLLQDFNYFFNKAINLYINKRYNIYDINQQTSDDLRVLKATATLDVQKTDNTFLKELSKLTAGKSQVLGATYEVDLPDDYLHILNCVCVYKLEKDFKCYNQNDYVPFSAKRLTADSFSQILNDYYQRPLPERPYFYIHNINLNNTLPTNPVNNTGGTDMSGDYNVTNYLGTTDGNEDTFKEKFIAKLIETPEYAVALDLNKTNISTATVVMIRGYKWDNNVENINWTETMNLPANSSMVSKQESSNFPRTINLKGLSKSVVEKETAVRYGNASKVRMEIRYGHDDSVFKLEKVLVDYIKTPQYIRLTQELMNLTEDTSQIMEFPDYVCQEIINELTMLVMENASNPRLLTNPTVSQSIANPAQQLTQPQPQQTKRG